MSYILFDNNGYEYFNKDDSKVFSADNTHDYLFDYIEKDLSCLPRLFQQYIAKKMDAITFELKKNPDSDKDMIKIIEILKSSHPYYYHEYKKVIIKEIGEYFNRLLLYSIFNRDKKRLGEKNWTLYENSINEKWYVKKFKGLIPASLVKTGIYPDGLYPDDFYHKYMIWLDERNYDKGEIEETFVPNVPRKMPTGFSDEINTKEIVYNMLFYILDIDTEDLNLLTIPQRIWLYGKMFHLQFDYIETEINQRFLFNRPIRFEKNYEYTQESKYEQQEIDGNLYKLYDQLIEKKIKPKNIPTELTECWKYLVGFAKTIDPPDIYEEYDINNLRQLLFLEIVYMTRNKTMIRKCDYCNKYFVPKSKKNKYCKRNTDSGKSCSIEGPKHKFKNKVNSNPLLKIYQDARRNHYMRFERESITRDEYDAWYDEAKKMLKMAEAGELDISTFQEWCKK